MKKNNFNLCKDTPKQIAERRAQSRKTEAAYALMNKKKMEDAKESLHKKTLSKTHKQLTVSPERMEDLVNAAKACECSDCDKRFPASQMMLYYRIPATKQLFKLGDKYSSVKQLRADIALCTVLCLSCYQRYAVGS